MREVYFSSIVRILICILLIYGTVNFVLNYSEMGCFSPFLLFIAVAVLYFVDYYLYKFKGKNIKILLFIALSLQLLSSWWLVYPYLN